ncbi:MAG: hypothetical protein MOGMAGMI_00645 [Candidatus Omnitrophica bacterium]|nr:hypothetical protein [Candidatus Omnitrophota bacterium]
MTHRALRLTLALLTLTLPARAAEILADSRIDAVTVYPDRAYVTRSASVELPAAGTHEIVFAGLPAGLIEDSLRVRGEGSSPVTVQGAEVRARYDAAGTDETVNALLADLERLRLELRAIESRSQAAADQKIFLDSVRDFSRVQVPKEIMTRASAPADWTPLSDFLYDAYEKNGARSLEIQKAAEAKHREIEAAERRLQEAGRGRSIGERDVIVTLECAAKTSFRVELAYLLAQATWHISYEARVLPKDGTCDLVAFGNVRQWSGEDWKDVRLSLSTARPSLGARMPELAPWYVDIHQPVTYEKSQTYARKASRENVLGSAAPAAMMAASADMETAPIEADVAQAAQSFEQGAVTFVAPKTTTVLSDNRSYRSQLSTSRLKAVLDYETTPKLSSSAYLHSKITNELEYPLAAGSVSVFSGGVYLGKSSIGAVGRGETFDLYLGIDEDIRVKRVELKDKGGKGLLGLRGKKTYAYRVDVENYKDTPSKVSVYDQLPVSRNEEVKSELSSASPQPAERKDLGILRWELDLKPREKKSVEFQFEVSYPADKPVVGV